jgi:hypothetical protein
MKCQSTKNANGALTADAASCGSCASEQASAESNGCEGTCKAASGGKECGKTSAATGKPEIEASPATGGSEALGYAQRLAAAVAERHYPEALGFQPAEDLLGVLLQLDNMFAGLSREAGK